MQKTLPIIISKLRGCGLFLLSPLNFFSCLYHESVAFYNQKKMCFCLVSFKYTTLTIIVVLKLGQDRFELAIILHISHSNQFKYVEVYPLRNGRRQFYVQTWLYLSKVSIQMRKLHIFSRCFYGQSSKLFPSKSFVVVVVIVLLGDPCEGWDSFTPKFFQGFGMSPCPPGPGTF